MNADNELIIVFTGSEIEVSLLMAELQKAGIASKIQDNFRSGVMAGFSGGLPSNVDLYVYKRDFEKAEKIIDGFKDLNNNG